MNQIIFQTPIALKYLAGVIPRMPDNSLVYLSIFVPLVGTVCG